MPNDHQSKRPCSSPLARLRRGEIDRDGYLDAKICEATAHSPLPASDLPWIRSVLRELCETDPILVPLIKRITAPDN
jgi:hypothetical protein